MQGALRIFYLVFATICQLGIILQVRKLRLKTSSSQGQHIKSWDLNPGLSLALDSSLLQTPAPTDSPSLTSSYRENDLCG